MSNSKQFLTTVGIINALSDNDELFEKWAQNKISSEDVVRMYSEEDLREAFNNGQDNIDCSEMYGFSSKLTEQEWFEQYKKK
jgi:diketogulonate reductase-like aldo/keto reductase